MEEIHRQELLSSFGSDFSVLHQKQQQQQQMNNNNKKQWFWLYVMYTTNLVFLNRGTILSCTPIPRGQLTMFEDNFDYHNWGELLASSG